MEEKCFLIPLCNLKTFNVILHRVIKGSFCVSLFPLRPVISGMLISTDFEANSHLFLPLLYRDSSLSYPFSQLPIFRPVSESVCLESNCQNCPKHAGAAGSEARSHTLVIQMKTHLQLPLTKRHH